MDARVMIVVLGLFVLGALLIALGRGRGGSTRAEWIKYATFACIVLGMLAAARLGRPVAAFLLLLITLRGAFEVGRVVGGRMTRAASLAILAACLGHLLLGDRRTWQGSFSFVFVVVATADSYAQLTGRLIGRHPLCPRLSPTKTVEGLIGGTIAAVSVGALLGSLVPAPLALALPLALVTAAAAVAGDLAFSLVKRRAGVKDFPGILPGHGGVCDRFDSLILAAPVYFWVRALLLR